MLKNNACKTVLSNNNPWQVFKSVLLFTALFFFCHVFTATGYTISITDSLKNDLKKITDPRIKLHKLLELAEKQIDLGEKEAIFTAETARSIAYSLKQDPERAQALTLQGIAWKIWGDNQKSILYLYEALEIYQRLNLKNKYAEVLMNIGETNRAAGNLSKSMELLNEALKRCFNTACFKN